jgi:hypothetical protein
MIAGLAVAGIALIAFEVAANARGAARRRAHRHRDAGGDPRPHHLGAIAILPRVSRAAISRSAWPASTRCSVDHRALVSIVIASLFVAANVVLMASYSPGLTAAALGVVAAAIALSIAIGLARVRSAGRSKRSTGGSDRSRSST